MAGYDDDASVWQAALAKRAGRALSSAEAAAVRALPIRPRTLLTHESFSREDGAALRCALVRDGALRQSKLTSQGTQQIVGVRLALEFVGLENLLLLSGDHDVQALGPCTLLEVPLADIRTLAREQPALGEMLHADAMIAGAIAQEWIVNIGRRDAQCRTAHLLCELALRLDGTTLAPGQTFLLPFNQQQLGDALGLSRVAINRILRDLARAGLIRCDRTMVTVLNADGLADAGDFSARYLHLDQSGRDRRRVGREVGAPRLADRAAGPPVRG